MEIFKSNIILYFLCNLKIKFTVNPVQFFRKQAPQILATNKGHHYPYDTNQPTTLSHSISNNTNTKSYLMQMHFKVVYIRSLWLKSSISKQFSEKNT